jgi:hypothetical protein
MPTVEHVIRRDRRLTEAANRAIDAALGKSTRRVTRGKEPWPKPGEVDEVFRAAKRGET